MVRSTIDLASYITRSVPENLACFPIELHPMYFRGSTGLQEVPERLAIVRTDTDRALAVVPGRCNFVTHQALLSAFHAAVHRLDAGPIQRAIYVDRAGARMRALTTLPGLAESVRERDMVCPCLMVENTYGRCGRILMHIGALRVSCGNLAVRGGGLFAGGFMRIPVGEIPADQLAQQFERCLDLFWRIVRAYRMWVARPLDRQGMHLVLKGLPPAFKTRIWQCINKEEACTLFDAYQAALHVGTHEMDSLRRAFDLIEHINAGMQRVFQSR
jgi:hypothetical protein